jgi:hypothetical protein
MSLPLTNRGNTLDPSNVDPNNLSPGVGSGLDFDMYLSLTALGLATNLSEMMSRPRGMTPKEESAYDKHCRGKDDQCLALKLATQQAINDARGKQHKMQFDFLFGNLYKHAFAKSNPVATGNISGTWLGHADELANRIAWIQAMISLGKKMGCDMTTEEVMASTLFVPRAPWR